MTEEEYNLKSAAIPFEFVDRFGYGLYGGVVQYYIKGVDGTLAQLGQTLPSTEHLEKIFINAKRQHVALLKRMGMTQ